MIVLTALLFLSTSVQAAGNFKTGWWTDIQKTSQLSQYAADGNTLVLALSGGWFTDASGRPVIQRFLDTAQANNLKAIVSLVRQNSTPSGIPVEEFVTAVNTFKNHPALYGWYIGDEPEKYKAGSQITHSYLATDPGYYSLLKSIDPVHPIMISFDMIYDPYDTYWAKISSFFDVTDLVGMHNYPFWSPTQYLAEFSGTSMRTQYDVWKYALNKTQAAAKSSFIATAQGFGYQSNAAIYRDPTYNELRYQTFSAIVQGIDHLLFWYDGWSNDTTKGLVKRVIADIQLIGKEMEAGRTNDPAVNVSIADRDQLVFRYGSNGTRHVLLAVNIANRRSASGAALTNVRFTLPRAVHASQVEVLDEGRIIPVTDGAFTDSFSRFEVHVYRFVTETAVNSEPPAPPSGVRVVVE